MRLVCSNWESIHYEKSNIYNKRLYEFLRKSCTCSGSSHRSPPKLVCAIVSFTYVSHLHVGIGTVVFNENPQRRWAHSLTEVALSVRLVEVSRKIASSCCNKPHNACNPDFLHGSWTVADMMWYVIDPPSLADVTAPREVKSVKI